MSTTSIWEKRVSDEGLWMASHLPEEGLSGVLSDWYLMAMTQYQYLQGCSKIHSTFAVKEGTETALVSSLVRL